MDWLFLAASPVNDFFDSIVNFIDKIPGLRVILAAILIFFLPGFAWSLIFFAGQQVNKLERFVLSIGLSIALVTLSMFGLNLIFGVKVTGSNAVIDILILTFTALAIYYLRKRKINWRKLLRRE